MDLDPLLWWNCLGSGLGGQESFRVRPGDVGVARAPRTCAWAFYLSSRTGSDPVHGSCPDGLDLLDVGTGDRSADLDPLLGWFAVARVWCAGAVLTAPGDADLLELLGPCLLYTSPSPRDGLLSRMPSSA